jgi:hypothetical protein
MELLLKLEKSKTVRRLLVSSKNQAFITESLAPILGKPAQEKQAFSQQGTRRVQFYSDH